MLSYADKLQPAILNLFAVKKRDLFLRNHNFMDVPKISKIFPAANAKIGGDAGKMPNAVIAVVKKTIRFSNVFFLQPLIPEKRYKLVGT